MLLTLIAQAADDFSYMNDYSTSTVDAQASGISMIGGLVYIVLIVLMIIGMWKIFAKAGRPGWHSIIPIYNQIVLLQIAGKPEWWFLLMFVPLVNIIVIFMMWSALSKSFGKSTVFTLGLIFVPFVTIPVLGFGAAKYMGSSARPTPMSAPVTPQV